MTVSPRELDGSHTKTITCDQQEFVPLPLLLTVEGERKIVGVIAVPLNSTTAFRVPESRLLNAITASLYLCTPATASDP